MLLPQIILPWAKTSELSANSRLHWRERYRLVKLQKGVAIARAMEAGWHKIQIPAEGDLRVTLTACPPSRGGVPDDDNLISAQKGALDALAAVLRVNDRRFRVQEVARGERCKDGAVIVRIEVMRHQITGRVAR